MFVLMQGVAMMRRFYTETRGVKKVFYDWMLLFFHRDGGLGLSQKQDGWDELFITRGFLQLHCVAQVTEVHHTYYLHWYRHCTRFTYIFIYIGIVTRVMKAC